MNWNSSPGLSLPPGDVFSTLHNRTSKESLAALGPSVLSRSGLWATKDPKLGAEPKSKQRGHRKKHKW